LPQPRHHAPPTHVSTPGPSTPGHSAVDTVALFPHAVSGCRVTHCLSCPGTTSTTTFPIFSILTNPGNHIPFASLDCNGSGCHTTSNVNAGGFKLGSASLTAPTLSVAGHTTVAAGVAACQTCHESAPYLGMIAGRESTRRDS